MRRKLTTLVAFTLLLSSLFSQSGKEVISSTNEGGDGASSEPRPQQQLIDIKANVVFPHKINDTLTVLCFVGDFAAHHNGAVITADSAVRYGDDRLECFGKVLINKNTTYAYADRADYDGEKNLAALYSSLVKVVDEDVTLYAKQFVFNTLDNIGIYSGGGVTTKRAESEEEQDVVMESQRGYYYADSKQVVGVEAVELRGEGYEMSGDSVLYDMQSERARFFKNTNIWNEKGEYLYGDRGQYIKADDLYRITKNGYLLTKEQEIWSDSMEYRSESQEAILWENIQIDDTTNKSLAFGDYGRYWGEVERILLTREPAVVNYDPNEVDSLFLRGDTIEIYSYALGTGPMVDSAEIRRVADLKERMKNATGGLSEVDSVAMESLADSVDMSGVDSVEVAVVDSTLVEVKRDGFFRRFVNFFKGDSTAKAERKAAFEAKSKARTEELERKRLADINAEKAREYRKLQQRREKLVARVDKGRAKGRNIYSDSMLLQQVQDELDGFYDSIPETQLSDSLAVVDTLSEVTTTVEEGDSEERDSLYRIIKVYRDVKSYRTDVQMVSDSLVAISYDTTMHLYIEPIIWAQSNQITAEQVDLYTREGDLDYAEFTGDPIMASELISGESFFYNQITGKTMKAKFENNEVVRNDVDGNVQTIYYLEDDDTKLVNTIAYVESGTASFHIKDQQLEGVTYRSQPNYIFAPIDMIPEEIPSSLDGFEWEAEKRPLRDSVFSRTIRPSIRTEKSELSRPSFPIESEQMLYRLGLEQDGVWFDRIELVSPDVVQWMEELGFTPGLPRENSEF